jgi:hypothetical protein
LEVFATARLGFRGTWRERWWQMARRDLLTRLADAGEDAISKLGETPGADRFMGAIGGMRDRVDELQRRVRGIEDLERRVAALEARLAEPPAKRTTGSRTARKPAASKTAKPGSSRAKQGDEPSSSSKTGGDSPG